MNGIIIIDKPKDYTSFDVIAVLRKKLGQRKIGHMGTLDPMATGVLPILLGETAKFQIYNQENDKRYIAKMHFGTTTDSLDITGKIITDIKSTITKKQLEKALNEFIGNIDQLPPMFSAIKKDGKKLYDLARKGIEIKRDRRYLLERDIYTFTMLRYRRKTRLWRSYDRSKPNKIQRIRYITKHIAKTNKRATT